MFTLVNNVVDEPPFSGRYFMSNAKMVIRVKIISIEWECGIVTLVVVVVCIIN